MSTLGIVALCAAGAWLGALTFTMALLIRQLAIVSAWAEQVTERQDDGLEAGTPVPELALELVPELATEQTYVIFLDSQCQPCREFALEAGRSEQMAALKELPIAAAVSGKGAQADEIARMLPPWVKVARGKEADRLKDSFRVVQTPSVYEVDAGKVAGRAVAGYGLVNFLNLVEARRAARGDTNGSNSVTPLDVKVVAAKESTGGGL
jgi:hypothetical protein